MKVSKTQKVVRKRGKNRKEDQKDKWNIKKREPKSKNVK